MLESSGAAERSLGAFQLVGKRVSRRELRVLRTLLDDTNPWVQESAAQALGAAGDITSLGAIVALMDSHSPRDGWGYAWAVGELGAAGDENAQSMAWDALARYKKRARGRSREHAAAIMRRLSDRSLRQG